MSNTKTNRFNGLMEAVKERQTEEQTTSVAAVKSRSGKSSNPDFAQISVYLPKETHRAAKRALLDMDQKMDLSELIDELLSKWVAARN